LPLLCTPGQDWLGLLPVVFQYLIAGSRNFGAILLEAAQDGEISLTDNRPTEALYVVFTRFLLGRSTTHLGVGDG
jgi:hypothetical protein